MLPPPRFYRRDERCPAHKKERIIFVQQYGSGAGQTEASGRCNIPLHHAPHDALVWRHERCESHAAPVLPWGTTKAQKANPRSNSTARYRWTLASPSTWAQNAPYVYAALHPPSTGLQAPALSRNGSSWEATV